MPKDSNDRRNYLSALEKLVYHPLLQCSLFEKYILELLAQHDGWITEATLFYELVPRGMVNMIYFTDLANKYDAYIEEMKLKHNLWTYIPKAKDENVILCTDEAKRFTYRSRWDRGYFKGPQIKKSS